MSSERSRARRQGARSPQGGAAPVRLGALLRRAIVTYVTFFVRISAVILASAVPVQLVLARLYVGLGIDDDPSWQMRYQGIASMSVGCLTFAAMLIAIKSAVDGEPGSIVHWIGRAYRGALRAWLGMFLTQLMVSFILIAAGLLPLLFGAMVLSALLPDGGWGAVTEALVAGTADGSQLASLLLLLPLGAGGVMIYLWYALAEAVVAIERLDGFEALQRSKALTRGARWVILGGAALLEAPLFVGELFSLDAAQSLGVWGGAALSCATMLVGALPATFLVHVYAVQRERIGAPTSAGDDVERGEHA